MQMTSRIPECHVGDWGEFWEVFLLTQQFFKKQPKFFCVAGESPFPKTVLRIFYSDSLLDSRFESKNENDCIFTQMRSESKMRMIPFSLLDSRFESKNVFISFNHIFHIMTIWKMKKKFCMNFFIQNKKKHFFYSYSCFSSFEYFFFTICFPTVIPPERIPR